METAPSVEEKPEINKPPKEISKEKSGKGLKIALIICIIFALAGLAFGIYGFLQNKQKDVKITELTAKIDLIKMETKTELVDKDEDGTTRTYVEPTEEVNPEGYIYIGSWGQKIKRPSELIYMEYKVTSFSYVQCLYVNAGRAEDKNLTADGGPLANIDVQSLGYVCRAPSSYQNQVIEGGKVANGKVATFAIGDYSYWYDGPNGARDESETAVIELLHQMLSNPSNYSAI